jgi:transposase InsO family protein
MCHCQTILGQWLWFHFDSKRTVATSNLLKTVNLSECVPTKIIIGDITYIRLRGRQYASNKFRKLLHINGFRQSMSGRGNCYDNAQAESFFSRFKAELIEGGTLADLEEARMEIFSYIEGYYNRIRLHSSLGYKSPMEFEVELKLKMEESKDSFLSNKT